MNNVNPFLPQGSLLEQKNKKRARVKVAVYSIFAFNILLISPLLIQGCSNKKVTEDPNASALTATNDVAPPDTNLAPPLPVPGTNVATAQPPAAAANTPVVMPPPPPATVVVPSSTPDYVVVKGDTFATISKKFGVSIKALEAANTDVIPSKMKVGKALHIPAATTPVTPASGATAMVGGSDTGDLYIVKSGDTLSKIAGAHGISIKAIRAANTLKTDKIKVGDKLRIPAKAAAPVAPVTPVDNTPMPQVTPLPAPGH